MAVAGVFILIIPLLFYLLDLAVFNTAVLKWMTKVSLAIGVIILLIFMTILMIELKQDRKRNILYNKVKFKKISISKGICECQYCGNQKVQENDLYCKVCGTKFIQ